MIGSLRGKIISKNNKSALVEAGGVGYKINLSPDTLLLAKTDSKAFFLIHTHVREDTLDLYGFTKPEELEFFEMLIGISGIGPRSALSILGVATIATLKRAIASGDISYLTKVSGIGKKTAEKILLELRDKVGKDGGGPMLQGELDALEALKSLGYSQHEAREALKKVPDGDANEKIKKALKILGSK